MYLSERSQATACCEWRDLGIEHPGKLFQGQTRESGGWPRGWSPEVEGGRIFKSRWLINWLWVWMREKRLEWPSGCWLGQLVMVSSAPVGNPGREAGSHWGRLEVPRRTNWNVPSLIPLGFSSLQTFSRLICCKILRCILTSLSHTFFHSASPLPSCREE